MNLARLVLFGVLVGCAGCVAVTDPPGKPVSDKELEQYRGVWLLRHGSSFGGKKRERDRRSPVYIQPLTDGQINIGLTKFENGKFVTQNLKAFVTQIGEGRYLSVNFGSHKHYENEADRLDLFGVELDEDGISLTLPDRTAFQNAVEEGALDGNARSIPIGIVGHEKLTRFIKSKDRKKLFPGEYIRLERASHDFRFPWTTGPDESSRKER